MRFLTMTSLLALAACGSSGGNDPAATPTDIQTTADALSFATKTGEAPANGLAFATALSELADVDGAGVINIKVARALTDWDAGTTELVISDETLEIETLADGFFAITLDGERLVFDADGNPANANAEQWSAYLDNTAGDVSGTGAIYSYAYGEDPDLTGEFDTEAFFVFGFETDPSEIADMVGEVVYSGGFNGYGQLLDADGAVFESEVFVEGAIGLTVSFDDIDMVNGTLTGGYAREEETEFNSFEMAFSTDIDGNGYAADLDCSVGCDDQSSAIAGAFFGQNAAETSGIIGFDISAEIENPDDPEAMIDTRFIAGAGFTATQALSAE